MPLVASFFQAGNKHQDEENGHFGQLQTLLWTATSEQGGDREGGGGCYGGHARFPGKISSTADASQNHTSKGLNTIFTA